MIVNDYRGAMKTNSFIDGTATKDDLWRSFPKGRGPVRLETAPTVWSATENLSNTRQSPLT